MPILTENWGSAGARVSGLEIAAGGSGRGEQPGAVAAPSNKAGTYQPSVGG